MQYDFPNPSSQALPGPPKGTTRSDTLTVVGIGASAGGLDACTKLVRGLPDGNGMAFILVQHRDPSQESLLVELLATHTAMTVLEATDGMPLERDHLYVIRPGNYLSTACGLLQLSKPTAPRGTHLPFDFLLSSLAEAYGTRAVCIVLSGTGTDGSLGLTAIRKRGGLVIVQDPEEAEYDGMPRSAIATGAVDLVLQASEMPDALATHPYATEAGDAAPAETGRNTVQDPVRQPLQAIVEFLRATTPHDFTFYKPGTLERRIERRMSAARAAHLRGYLDLLRADPAEAGLLASDLLINVTSFFRDP